MRLRRREAETKQNKTAPGTTSTPDSRPYPAKPYCDDRPTTNSHPSQLHMIYLIPPASGLSTATGIGVIGLATAIVNDHDGLGVAFGAYACVTACAARRRA